MNNCLNSLTALLLAAASAFALSDKVAAVPQLVPVCKTTQTLVASATMGERNYPAFPILLHLSETELLVGYKRGRAHWSDPGAGFEILRVNPASGAVDSESVNLQQGNLIFQNGEFVRFPNGDIACYIDVQKRLGEAGQGEVVRSGLLGFRSTNAGRTFCEAGKLGIIDGIEYGYAFDALTEGQTTWMLVMAFANLTGGESISPSWPNAGSVNVIRTDDNGKTWRFVKALTGEFGNHPINESCFVRYGSGFIVAARGYEDAQWLQVTDAGFNLRRQANLATTNGSIRAYLGRPRVFVRDGGCYLLGRNYTGTPTPGGDPKATPSKLSLIRFDPVTLAVTKHVLLDNAESARVIDGYYAVPYWAGRNGETFFNVITYKAMAGRPPDLLRLEYNWNEVR